MAKRKPAKARSGAAERKTENYRHPEANSPLRPDVGTQAQFRKKKPPATYRYDSSLSPALDWDGRNPAREEGEAAIREILDLDPSTIETAKTAEQAKSAARATIAKAKDAAEKLKRLSRPFLNWAGKAERLSFDVPTLPLFVHERLSTKAIIETLKSHERKLDQADMFALFGDPNRPIADQVLRAYEYRDDWVNRMILGDSLVVMNSLLHYEGLGGQVQMIYIDPPYGVKFGSNFQPFVRKRDVSHNDDEDMTREPEMVKAYRDTWELGLHSYLTYLRDRLLLARDLLAPTGSIFVQISDENVHHVREMLDGIFAAENFVTSIVIQKTSSEESDKLANVADYILWYARDRERLRSHQLYRRKCPGDEGAKQYVYKVSPDFSRTERLSAEEIVDPSRVPTGWRICRRGYPLSSQEHSPTRSGPFIFEGQSYGPGKNRHWSIDPEKGLAKLVKLNRIYSTGKSLCGIMLLDDMPGSPIGNVWTDTGTGSFTDEQLFVVQTSEIALERCILLATEPGDLVLDPTCGSGTTAYVAERSGRRWITIDTSRVPLALARQRLLAATYPYFRLKDEERGPTGGFDFADKENTRNRASDSCGVHLHYSLASLAGEEAPKPIIFRDKPEIDYAIVRVTGPFCVEATVPGPADDVDETSIRSESEPQGVFLARMLEVLRRSPLLQLGGGKSVTLRNARRPAKSLSLSAEATVDVSTAGGPISLADAVVAADERNKGALPLSQIPVALVFGPENGAISERLVFEAAREAHAKKYAHLYVIGFAIQPNARRLIEDSEAAIGIPATYVQATPDLMMGDLLKTMRSSQIFSVCGMPEVRLKKLPPGKAGEPIRYEASLLGLDVFDPVTMELDHRNGDDVPAWMLDTNYNGLVFHGSQVFFPRTSAWDNLKKALRATHEETVWDHLAGTTSAPFEGGEHGQIAVKVIDDRGNELLVVKSLAEAE